MDEWVEAERLRSVIVEAVGRCHIFFRYNPPMNSQRDSTLAWGCCRLIMRSCSMRLMDPHCVPSHNASPFFRR